MMAEAMFFEAIDLRSSFDRGLNEGGGEEAAELVADDSVDDGGELTAGVYVKVAVDDDTLLGDIGPLASS